MFKEEKNTFQYLENERIKAQCRLIESDLLVIENTPTMELKLDVYGKLEIRPSKFVGWVLKKLKNTNCVLVTYIPLSKVHVGFIFQATNWLYTGNINGLYRYIYFKNQDVKKLKLGVLNYPKVKKK